MIDDRVAGFGVTLMSFSSGCVDILSYRFLGQVFTSAMTGNVALMGLDFGQGNLAAAGRNLIAFLCFLAGLTLGAMLLRGRPQRAGLVWPLSAELLLLLAFAALWRLHGPQATLYALIGLSAVAMGLQSAVAHRIGMPGISTTYFTGTLTNIVFGLVGPAPAHPLVRVQWPALAFLAYIAGAVLAGWWMGGMNPLDLPLSLPVVPAVAIAGLVLTLAVARE
ncbi:MAG: YoaK family protein [Geminicoccaceae bacterium]